MKAMRNLLKCNIKNLVKFEMKNFLYYLIIFIFFSFPVFSQTLKFSKLINLSSPWGMSFIDDNQILVTEKDGKILLINLYTDEINEIEHNLKILSKGQGGLLDIIYQRNNVWVSYSEDRGSGKTSTSISKGTFNKSRINFINIFRAEPPIDSGYHFGSRLAIKDEYLFATIGERGKGMIAQDYTQHPGSIIRIYLDGTIPKDNPKYTGKNDWLPEIFQIGVRNPQGLTLSPFDNKVYASNHGARGGDWFGEIKKSENYGWKILGWGGINYSGREIGPMWLEGFTRAIYYWVPSIAVSAITIYKGEEFNEWEGDALVTSLKDRSLRKLNFKNLANIEERVIFSDQIGRIRDIQIHSLTGKIFFLSNNGLWLMEKK